LTDTFDEQVISEFRTRGGVVSGFQDLSLLCCITSAPSRDLNASRRSRFGRSATTPSQSLRRIEAHHDIRTGTTTWWPTQQRPWRSGRDVVGSGSGGGCRGAPQRDRPIGGGGPVRSLRRGSNFSPDSRRHPRAAGEDLITSSRRSSALRVVSQGFWFSGCPCGSRSPAGWAMLQRLQRRGPVSLV